MSDNKLRIRFRGVRGSHPVPGPGTVRFGGNTSCVEVQAGDHLIVLDAGTGIVSLGNDLLKNHAASGKSLVDRKPIAVTILFSHTHHDHTQGFAFFKPAYIPTSTCYLFGPRLREKEIEEGLSVAMVSPYFPVEMSDLNSLRKVRSLKESEEIVFQAAGSAPEVHNYYRENQVGHPYFVRIRAMHSYAHPNGGVFVYKIEMDGKSVVYATDTEGYTGGDCKLIGFARGSDLLIHDSQYMASDYVNGDFSVQGFGHSTVDMAAEVASKAGVGRLALFHYDPAYDDSTVLEMEKRAKGLFANSIAAYEGMEIEL